MFMGKERIKYLIEEAVEELFTEHREELAADYRRHMERNFPELHTDLEKLAKFAITAVRNGYSPSKKLGELSGLLRIDPEFDPRASGDTHGVRLYIDGIIDDNKLAGQAKRWYQSTIDQLLKKYYTAPRKQRERKFKKYIKNKNAKKESLQDIINSIITEQLEEAATAVRKPLNMPVPNDLIRLSKIFNENGFDLFIVGGAVRDALLGKQPKDYDVATDAEPEKVLELISSFPEYKTLEIGKAFGVTNVITPDGNEYEIATFREDLGKGRRPDAVRFSTIETDVKRRDLTINALFYDIADQEVVDYVGGIEDLENGRVRAVGNPAERFDEDRLRILRAIRFAARLGAGLGKETEKAISDNNSLSGVSPERIRDEFIKSTESAKSVTSLYRLYDTFNLWEQIFPGLSINTWYKETKNISVQLALLLSENDPKLLAKKLNSLKYSALETKQIVFLNLFQTLSPENAYNLKKLWKSTGLAEQDLEEFSNLNGEPNSKLVKAFNKYSPSVSGQEVMNKGYKGREIGREIERLETEKFLEVLKSV